MGGIVQCRNHFSTSGPAPYASRGTSGGARANGAVASPLAAFFVPQYRQTELFRQNFRSGAGGYMDQFLTDRKVNRLCWLAKCINIAVRDSGMRGEGQ